MNMPEKKTLGYWAVTAIGIGGMVSERKYIRCALAGGSSALIAVFTSHRVSPDVSLVH